MMLVFFFFHLVTCYFDFPDMSTKVVMLKYTTGLRPKNKSHYGAFGSGKHPAGDTLQL